MKELAAVVVVVVLPLLLVPPLLLEWLVQSEELLSRCLASAKPSWKLTVSAANSADVNPTVVIVSAASDATHVEPA